MSLSNQPNELARAIATGKMGFASTYIPNPEGWLSG
jgi:hypothetical protein